MADLSVTAANVGLQDNKASTKRVQFGEAVDQGEAVYLKAADGKYYLAMNDGTEEQADFAGVAIDKAGAGGWGYIVREGKYNPGATVAVGTTYCVSDTPGGICPDADVDGGKYKKIIGVATAADTITIERTTSLVQVPAE